MEQKRENQTENRKPKQQTKKAPILSDDPIPFSLRLQFQLSPFLAKKPATKGSCFLEGMLVVVTLLCLWSCCVCAQYSSQVIFCHPPSTDCSHMNAHNTTSDVRKIHSLYLCDPGSVRALDVGILNQTEFLRSFVIALSYRRRLCDAEHNVISKVLSGAIFANKEFNRRRGFPGYQSYDLLAATLLSIHPRRIGTLTHEHLDSHLHTPFNKAHHNDNELLYNVPAGAWLEFGVASGYSINVTATVLERRNLTSKVPLYGFDSFFGLPVTWTGHMAQGFFSTGGVIPHMHKHVQIYQGLFNETLQPFMQHVDRCQSGRSVMGVSIDNDLYDGALLVLKTLHPCLRNGSVLHFHELFSSKSGKNPMEELLALYDYMTEHHVVLRLMPVMSSSVEAAVFSVLQIAA